MKFTQQEMADLVGVSRVRVAGIMKKLEENGIITKKNGYIYITSNNKVVQAIREEIKEEP